METSAVKAPKKRSRSSSAPARTQLDRNDWINAAIDVLAQSGLNGLRVEVVAKCCGVTKGSFYWHFKDRQDLLAAVLERWREGRLRDIEKTLAMADGKETDQLRYAIEVYGASRNRKGMSIELAVRDWARRDAEAAAVVEGVDLYRLECTRKLFVASGMSETEAKSRSLLLYAAVFGLSLMHYTHFDNDLSKLKERIAQLIVPG